MRRPPACAPAIRRGARELRLRPELGDDASCREQERREGGRDQGDRDDHRDRSGGLRKVLSLHSTGPQSWFDVACANIDEGQMDPFETRKKADFTSSDMQIW